MFIKGEKILSLRFTAANSKSSSPFLTQSLIISMSAIQSFSLFDDGFQKKVSHLKPLLKFLRSIDQKINRDLPVHQATEFPDPVGSVKRGVLFDDQEISVTVRISFPSRSASKEDDFFGNLDFSPNLWILKDIIDRFLMAEFQSIS
jgi:hypothetical protein